MDAECWIASVDALPNPTPTVHMTHCQDDGKTNLALNAFGTAAAAIASMRSAVKSSSPFLSRAIRGFLPKWADGRRGPLPRWLRLWRAQYFLTFSLNGPKAEVPLLQPRFCSATFMSRDGLGATHVSAGSNANDITKCRCCLPGIRRATGRRRVQVYCSLCCNQVGRPDVH